MKRVKKHTKKHQKKISHRRRKRTYHKRRTHTRKVKQLRLFKDFETEKNESPVINNSQKPVNIIPGLKNFLK